MVKACCLWTQNHQNKYTNVGLKTTIQYLEEELPLLIKKNYQSTQVILTVWENIMERGAYKMNKDQYITGALRRTSAVEMERIKTSMVLFTQASGWTTSSMVSGNNP